MGLTHYWERETELDAQAFSRAVEDIRRVVKELPSRLAGRDGNGEPIFRADAVLFNGEAEAAYEPFEIHQTQFDQRGRKRFFQNVKTGGRPYDTAVKVALICFKHHLHDQLCVTSDAADADWDDARTRCVAVLGYGNTFALER